MPINACTDHSPASAEELNYLESLVRDDYERCHPGDSGLQSPRQRANLIAYLRSLSDNPVPLPSLPSAPNPSTGSGPAQDPYQKNSTGGG